MEKPQTTDHDLENVDPEIITQEWLNTTQVAEIFGVSLSTVSGWITQGVLTPRTRKEGRSRQNIFDPAEVRQLAEKRAEKRSVPVNNALSKLEMVVSGQRTGPAGDTQLQQVHFRGQTELQTVITSQSRMLRDQHAHIQELHEQGIKNSRLLTDAMGRLEKRVEESDKERLKFFRTIEETYSLRHQRELETERNQRKIKLMEGMASKIMMGLDLAMPKVFEKLGIKPATSSSSSDDEADAGDAKELEGPDALRFFIGNAITVSQWVGMNKALGPELSKELEAVLAPNGKGDKALRSFAASVASHPEKLSELGKIFSAEQVQALQKIVSPYLV